MATEPGVGVFFRRAIYRRKQFRQTLVDNPRGKSRKKSPKTTVLDTKDRQKKKKVGFA